MPPALLTIDPNSPVEIEVKAESPAIFRFTAQFRVPGHDYVDFASAKDSGEVSQSTYRVALRAPIQSPTDLRIYFLIDGPAKRPYRIRVQCYQNGKALGTPIFCEGDIGKDGKIAFKSVEARLV